MLFADSMPDDDGIKRLWYLSLYGPIKECLGEFITRFKRKPQLVIGNTEGKTFLMGPVDVNEYNATFINRRSKSSPA